MDALDLRILRTMGVVPFGVWPHSADSLKPSFLAERLRVPQDRVYDRIARMEADGVITGYDVMPNPLAFGLREKTFHVLLPAGAKAGALQELSRLERVFGLYDYVGDHACIQLYFRDKDDLEAALQRVASTAGRTPRPFFDRPYPTPKRSLTPLDARILKALRGRARRAPAEVAAEVGIATRTVKRRLDSMAAAGLYDVYVWMDVGAFRGMVPFELSIEFEGPRRSQIVPAVLRAMDAHYLSWWEPPAADWAGIEVHMLCASTREAERLRSTIAAVPGVQNTEVLVPTSSKYSGQWLDGALDAVAAHRPAKPIVP